MQIEQIFKFTSKEIKIYGTSEIPYFRGKDIAEILEYSNTDQAIRKNIRDKNKRSLREIIDILGPISGIGPLQFNENDLKTIYINEAGLYELIMKSKMNEAIKF